MIHYIYVLVDPRDDRIRYVGQTPRLEGRYKEHCGRQYKKDHRANWLNKLRSFDLKPIMQAIEECNEYNWTERETYWIKHYREVLGCDLTNTTDGGEGTVGYIPSQETRRKLSESQKGKTRSEETKHKISEANKGKTRSEETKRKIGAVSRNRNEETRLKISDAMKGNQHALGKTHSEEAKYKMREAAKNRSEEHRRKLSEAHKGKTHNEKTKRKISEATKGENNPNFGKTPNEESKRKMSESAKLAHQRRKEKESE